MVDHSKHQRIQLDHRPAHCECILSRHVDRALIMIGKSQPMKRVLGGNQIRHCTGKRLIERFGSEWRDDRIPQTGRTPHEWAIKRVMQALDGSAATDRFQNVASIGDHQAKRALDR